METFCINRDDFRYPPIRTDLLANAIRPTLHVVGVPGILHAPMLGLLCSIRCPGSIILKTFDAIRLLRDAGITLIGGFQSPMEKDCLDILLRGDQQVILCAAKGLRGLRIGSAARKAVKEGRLLLLSPFSDDVRRTTAEQAVQRNELIASLASDIFVPHAAPGGKAEALCRSIAAEGKRLYTIDSVDNSNLVMLGAKPFSISHMPAYYNGAGSSLPSKSWE